MSQAEVPINPIAAATAHAPSRIDSASWRRAGRASRRVRRSGALAPWASSSRRPRAAGVVGVTVMPARPWRVSLTTRSATATRAGRWATTSAVRPWTRRRDRREHLVLGVTVEVGGGLVEDQERRVAQERPGQGQPLALTGRQARPALAQHGVEALGQPVDQVGEAGVVHRPADPLGRGVGPAEGDVVGQGPGEQVGSLGDPGHLGPPRVGVQVGQIERADPDSARGRTDEAQHHLEQGRLPAAARAGQGHDLARGDGEVDPVEGRLGPARVADHQVGDDQAGHRRVRKLGPRPGHRHRALEDGEDLVGGGHPLGAGVVILAQLPQRQVGLGRQDQDEQARSST